MNENKEENKCDILKWAVIGLIAFAIAVFIFGAGVFIGAMKARFSYRWAENYHNNFGGPRTGFFGDWQKMPFPPDFIESRGNFGQIIKINDSDIVIKGKDNTEKVIVITSQTLIEKGKNEIKKEDLKVDDYIVVIGSPNDQGQIEAKLIRIFNDKNQIK